MTKHNYDELQILDLNSMHTTCGKYDTTKIIPSNVMTYNQLVLYWGVDAYNYRKPTTIWGPM